MDWRDFFDTGILRYGVSTAEKEKAALARALPAAPIDTSAGQEKANRYAAGYLFALHWPRLAPKIMPIISATKTSNLWKLGGDDPELQSYAQAGMNRALSDIVNRYTTPVNVADRPWEDYTSEEAQRIRKRRPMAAVQAEGLEE